MEKWYAGINNSKKTSTVFKSLAMPTEEKYGHLYGHIFGGYRTRKQAIDISNYQTMTYKLIILKGIQ